MCEKLLRVREVATRLSVSTRQVRKLVRIGRMPEPIRLSGAIRWREADVDRFIASGCETEEISNGKP